MPSSQHSFETLINRFDNGLTIINTWADYNPTNLLIKKATLTTFVQSVKDANDDVSTKVEALETARNERILLVFKQKDENPSCLEQRIVGIRNYIKGENFPKSALSTLEKIIKKIRPQYPKKEAGAPRGAGKSPSEKSFAAAVTYCKTVINTITRLGAGYVPPDANLRIPAMNILLTAIETSNDNVQIALDNYGTSNRTRLALYTSADGLDDRRAATLNYLSSFPGLKKSNHYIEFSQALRGI